MELLVLSLRGHVACSLEPAIHFFLHFGRDPFMRFPETAPSQYTSFFSEGVGRNEPQGIGTAVKTRTKTKTNRKAEAIPSLMA